MVKEFSYNLAKPMDVMSIWALWREREGERGCVSKREEEKERERVCEKERGDRERGG